ncbi:hypothetical protein trd_A0149 (plasmid) [Thermomicrobium roseum DSM 5159]|uniref:Uncharacterized protein n=1 Tax=Thermomicrobium roseum (strain ATCC 27502 / DSM 5159 / P-2) TaxID=309801 RepID=B9L2Y5_THERP|nr:hypothetical protein trd_A0149 [Thermomicrobium roseum DSM 5159]
MPLQKSVGLTKSARAIGSRSLPGRRVLFAETGRAPHERIHSLRHVTAPSAALPARARTKTAAVPAVSRDHRRSEAHCRQGNDSPDRHAAHTHQHERLVGQSRWWLPSSTAGRDALGSTFFANFSRFRGPLTVRLLPSTTASAGASLCHDDFLHRDQSGELHRLSRERAAHSMR